MSNKLAAMDNLSFRHMVICPVERAQGFVRPLRDEYIHKACGGTTRLFKTVAVHMAQDPKFYEEVYCHDCKKFLPVSEFVWEHSAELVGS